MSTQNFKPIPELRKMNDTDLMESQVGSSTKSLLLSPTNQRFSKFEKCKKYMDKYRSGVIAFQELIENYNFQSVRRTRLSSGKDDAKGRQSAPKNKAKHELSIIFSKLLEISEEFDETFACSRDTLAKKIEDQCNELEETHSAIKQFMPSFSDEISSSFVAFSKASEDIITDIYDIIESLKLTSNDFETISNGTGKYSETIPTHSSSPIVKCKEVEHATKINGSVGNVSTPENRQSASTGSKNTAHTLKTVSTQEDSVPASVITFGGAKPSPVQCNPLHDEAKVPHAKPSVLFSKKSRFSSSKSPSPVLSDKVTPLANGLGCDSLGEEIKSSHFPTMFGSKANKPGANSVPVYSQSTVNGRRCSSSSDLSSRSSASNHSQVSVALLSSTSEEKTIAEPGTFFATDSKGNTKPTSLTSHNLIHAVPPKNADAKVVASSVPSSAHKKYSISSCKNIAMNPTASMGRLFRRFIEADCNLMEYYQSCEQEEHSEQNCSGMHCANTMDIIDPHKTCGFCSPCTYRKTFEPCFHCLHLFSKALAGAYPSDKVWCERLKQHKIVAQQLSGGRAKEIIWVNEMSKNKFNLFAQKKMMKHYNKTFPSELFIENAFSQQASEVYELWLALLVAIDELFCVPDLPTIAYLKRQMETCLDSKFIGKLFHILLTHLEMAVTEGIRTLDQVMFGHTLGATSSVLSGLRHCISSVGLLMMEKSVPFYQLESVLLSHARFLNGVFANFSWDSAFPGDSSPGLGFMKKGHTEAMCKNVRKIVMCQSAVRKLVLSLIVLFAPTGSTESLTMMSTFYAFLYGSGKDFKLQGAELLLVEMYPTDMYNPDPLYRGPPGRALKAFSCSVARKGNDHDLGSSSQSGSNGVTKAVEDVKSEPHNTSDESEQSPSMPLVLPETVSPAPSKTADCSIDGLIPPTDQDTVNKFPSRNVLKIRKDLHTDTGSNANRLPKSTISKKRNYLLVDEVDQVLEEVLPALDKTKRHKPNPTFEKRSKEVLLQNTPLTPGEVAPSREDKESRSIARFMEIRDGEEYYLAPSTAVFKCVNNQFIMKYKAFVYRKPDVSFHMHGDRMWFRVERISMKTETLVQFTMESFDNNVRMSSVPSQREFKFNKVVNVISKNTSPAISVSNTFPCTILTKTFPSAIQKVIFDNANLPPHSSDRKDFKIEEYIKENDLFDLSTFNGACSTFFEYLKQSRDDLKMYVQLKDASIVEKLREEEILCRRRLTLMSKIAFGQQVVSGVLSNINFKLEKMLSENFLNRSSAGKDNAQSVHNLEALDEDGKLILDKSLRNTLAGLEQFQGSVQQHTDVLVCVLMQEAEKVKQEWRKTVLQCVPFKPDQKTRLQQSNIFTPNLFEEGAFSAVRSELKKKSERQPDPSSSGDPGNSV